MSDLNFVLRRMSQRASDVESDHLEAAATATLLVLLALIVLASLF